MIPEEYIRNVGNENHRRREVNIHFGSPDVKRYNVKDSELAHRFQYLMVGVYRDFSLRKLYTRRMEILPMLRNDHIQKK